MPGRCSACSEMFIYGQTPANWGETVSNCFIQVQTCAGKRTEFMADVVIIVISAVYGSKASLPTLYARLCRVLSSLTGNFGIFSRKFIESVKQYREQSRGFPTFSFEGESGYNFAMNMNLAVDQNTCASNQTLSDVRWIRDPGIASPPSP